MTGIDISDSDVLPLSGNAIVDSVLYLENYYGVANWNRVGVSQGNTLYYWFADGDDIRANINNKDAYDEAPNSLQKIGFVQALNEYSLLTGIQFKEASSADKANIYFALSDMDEETLGMTLPSDVIKSWDKCAVFLNIESKVANNADPTFGTPAFVTLMHELGHAFGLKHSFVVDEENDALRATLPSVIETQATSIMSYTDPSKDNDDQYSYERWYDEGKDYFAPCDIMALVYIYGTDGLNGEEGLTYDMNA